jgi:hypothetical protein
MAWEIGTATSAGAGGLAHYDMLDRIAEFATTNSALVSAGQAFQILRYNEAAANRELILKGTGLGGTDEIFIGFRTQQSVSADYYNLVAGVFVGYVPSTDFDGQPGAMLSGVPAHNQAIEYYMIANGQRIALAMKVGTPVYMSGYVGKMLPYATPGEFRAPLVCAGMLNGSPATRFSDPTISMPYKGTRPNMRLRGNDGVWKQPDCYPYNNAWLCGTAASGDSYQVRPTGANYFPMRIELNDSVPNLYGALDGLFYIPGFDNAVENVLQLGGTEVVDQAGKSLTTIITDILAVAGRPFLIIQDGARTGFNDYYCMEMG